MKFSRDTLGRFEIQRKLGSGAFGAVYLARDPQLDRTVALKIPHFSGDEDSKQVSRFLREAKAAGGLHHPNIVAVHDAGKLEGHYYIASAYIDGPSLRELIKKHGKPTPKAAAKLISKLASALAYAHVQGIVHRDVKPENILMDKEGTPHLVDFGLAKRDIVDALHTQDGTILGTPAYMSPEQASGKGSSADGQTDQWSLGVIFFELLTGMRPFDGPSMQLMYAIQHSEVPSLRKLNPQIPADLETICLKALQKNPNDRFNDCFELQRDLERWLSDEPILSRRQTIVERVQRWGRQNPSLSKLTAAFLSVVACLSFAVLTQWLRAELNARRISQTLGQVENQKRRLETLSQDLEQRTIALDQQNQMLNKNNLDLESANKTIANTLREIQNKEKLILSTTEQKSRAEKEAEQARLKSEDERQRRQNEQSKNKALRYFGEIQTAKMALSSGGGSDANEILKNTIPSSRSLEWEYLTRKSRQAESPFKLIEGVEKLDKETQRFILSVHFPDQPVDLPLIRDLASSPQIRAINESGNAWLTQDTEENVVAAVLPVDNRGTLATIASTFIANKIRAASYGQSVTSIDELVIEAWMSPDGNYVACLCPKMRSEIKSRKDQPDRPRIPQSQIEPRDKILVIDIDLEVVMLSLSNPQYGRRTVPIDRPLNVHIEIRESLTEIGSYSAECNPRLWPRLKGLFSSDSTQFLLVDRDIGELSSFVFNDQGVVKQSSRRMAVRGTEVAHRFAKNGDYWLANEYEVLVINPTTLETIRKVPLKWPGPPNYGAMFSRSGASLAIINMEGGSKPTNGYLNLSVYNFERQTWKSSRVTQEMMVAADHFSKKFANPDLRSKAIGQQIYLADFVFDDLVDDRLSRWVSLRLKNGQQYFFTDGVVARADTNSEVWKGPSIKDPIFMRYDSLSSSLFLGFKDRLLEFRSDKKENRLRLFSNAVPTGGGMLLEMAVCHAGGGVAISQNERLSLFDPNSKTFLKSFDLKNITSLLSVAKGRLACARSNGELSIVSESDGEVLRNFPVNRSGNTRIAFCETDNILVLVGVDRRVVVWDLTHEKQIAVLFSDVPTKNLRFNQKSKMLTLVGIDNSVTVYQLPGMRRVAAFQATEGDILWCDTSNDGKRLVRANAQTVELFDLELAVGVLELFQFPSKPLLVEVDCSRWVVYAYMPDGRLHEFVL